MPPRRSARKKTVARKPDRKSQSSAENSSFDVEDVNDAEVWPDSQESSERIHNAASTEIAVAEMESGSAAGAVSEEIFTVEDKGEAMVEDTVVEHEKLDADLKETSALRSFLDGEGIARLGEILHNVLGQNSSLINADFEELKAEDATIGGTESDANCKGADRDFVDGETVMAKNEERGSSGSIGESSRDREIGIEKEEKNDMKIGEERLGDFSGVREDRDDVKDRDFVDGETVMAKNEERGSAGSIGESSRDREVGIEKEEKNDMKIGEERLYDFSGVREDRDDVKDSISGEKEKDNGVLALSGHVGESAEVKSGNEEKESILHENNAVVESFVHVDGFSEARKDADEEKENGDDKNRKHVAMESLEHMDSSPRGKEDDDGESTNNEEEEDNLATESTMNEDGLRGLGKADEQKEAISGDANEDNQDVESGHSKDSIDVQNGCDDGELILDDSEDAEGNGDRKEVRTVYVKGLTKSWNVKKLEETCKQYGEVENIRLPHRFGAKHRDFGFIAFTSYKSALSCVEAINNSQLGGQDTKVKAELAKSKQRDQRRTNGKKDHVHSKVAGIVGQGTERNFEKSKRTETKGKAVAKEALPESKNGKECKPNKNQPGISKQDSNPGKMDRKRKNFHPEASNTRNMVPENDKRQSKRSRVVANARDTKTNKNSRRKPQYGQRPVHGVEYNAKHTASAGSYRNPVRSVVSISKRQHLDMAPHAGYLEPATNEQAHLYTGYNRSSHGHQQQFHASYHEPASKTKGQPLIEYPKPDLGREALPHAGYLESAVRRQRSAVYDQRLMRTSGYDGRGIQGFVYREGSVVPTLHAPQYSSSVGYQVRGRDDHGAYPPPRKYY